MSGFSRPCAPVEWFDRLVDRQHAVDRRLVAAGQLGGHHCRAASVAAEDRLDRLRLRGIDHLAQLDQLRPVRLCATATGVAARDCDQLR